MTINKMHQLDLFEADTTTHISGMSGLLSGMHFRCLGMVLPADFQQVRAPVQIINRAIAMPASVARLSVCCFEWREHSLSAHECSGGVWLWAFQAPGHAQGESWPLCSAHELLTCRCPGCNKVMSPYGVLCERCVLSGSE